MRDEVTGELPRRDPSRNERQNPLKQAETIAALGSLIAGIQKHPPVGGVLAIDGTNYTAVEVVQEIQSLIDPLNATHTARATYLDATKVSEAAVSDKKVFVRDLKQTLQLMFSTSAATLADYGLAPRKTRTRSAADKVAATEKAKATRVARGTKGKRQKAEIVGNVTGVTITPIVIPRAAATTTPVTAAVTAAVVTSK